MDFGRGLLTIYAIWGRGGFARFLRATAVQFGVLFVQFMICFWLWTLAPLFMIFAIPLTYILWLWSWKMWNEVRFERAEAKRKAEALRWVDTMTKED